MADGRGRLDEGLQICCSVIGAGRGIFLVAAHDALSSAGRARSYVSTQELILKWHMRVDVVKGECRMFL